MKRTWIKVAIVITVISVLGLLGMVFDPRSKDPAAGQRVYDEWVRQGEKGKRSPSPSP